MLSACGGAVLLPTPDDCVVANIKVKLVTSDRLNMDEEGNSLPTILRVFQLKAETTIKNADFEGLWRDPKEALGEDFLTMSEVTVYPSSEETMEFPREDDAAFIAVMGVFRKQTGTGWRLWKPIPSPTATECKSSKKQNRKFSLFFEDYQVKAHKAQ